MSRYTFRVLLAIFMLTLLCSCKIPSRKQPGYVQQNNEIYGLPGQKAQLALQTDVKTLDYHWASDNLVLVLQGPDQRKIEIPIRRQMDWKKRVEYTTTNLLVGVEIPVPADAPVPSDWSGKISGTVTIPHETDYLKFENRQLPLDAPVVLHVTDQQSVNDIVQQKNSKISEDDLKLIVG
ncbi:MAG: hypothetical protein ACKOC5_06935 [Chloroflexota bacterium]